jgi:predicted PurR-regulated permease PerM
MPSTRASGSSPHGRRRAADAPSRGGDRGEEGPPGGLPALPVDVRSVALTALLILASFYAIYGARAFLLPVVLAVLLSFLLRPVVRALHGLYVPEPVSAALILVTFLGTVGFSVYKLSAPANAWLLTAPESLRRIQDRLETFREPIRQMQEAAEQVQNMGNVGGGAKPQAVAIQDHDLGRLLVSSMQNFVAGAAVLFFLAYFLLASGDLFLRKLVHVLPRLEDKKVALEIYRKIEKQIANYLLSLTSINVAIGSMVAVVMWTIGLPNPILWGAMVALFSFVPYLGPMTSMVVLMLVGMMTFDHLGWALLPPGLYFCIDVVNANLVIPAVLGRRLELNPVVVFLGVTFWGWLWGIAGAILAVPMVAIFKIFCDEIAPLAPIGEFLGE